MNRGTGKEAIDLKQPAVNQQTKGRRDTPVRSDSRNQKRQESPEVTPNQRRLDEMMQRKITDLEDKMWAQ